MSPWKLLSAQELSHRVHGAAELAQILACPVSLGPSIGEIPLSQNTAVSRVIYDKGSIRVDYYDDLSHLEPKVKQEVSI